MPFAVGAAIEAGTTPVTRPVEAELVTLEPAALEAVSLNSILCPTSTPRST